MTFRCSTLFVPLLFVWSASGCGTVADSGDVTDSVPDTLSDASPTDTSTSEADYTGFGPYTVGHVHFDLIDTARDRLLPVEIWYPATESVRADFEAGKDIAEMSGEDNKAQQTPCLEDPSPCLTTMVHAVRDAEPASGQWPLIAFSHCSGCIRTSNVSTVERLASHGMAVVAADHIGDTLWDSIRDGTSSGLAESFLTKRGQDVVFMLDSVLDSDNEAVPAPVRGRFDIDRIAMFGHSFGGLTTGLVTTTDSRIKGAVIHTAPFAGYYYLVQPENCTRPVYTIMAMEDAMITMAGNIMLRDDFARLSGPAWKVEVPEVGHLSFYDLCKVKDTFFDCCGEGARQSDYSYDIFFCIDQDETMQFGATATTAYMAWLLKGDSSARDIFEDAGNERFDIEIRNDPALD